MRAKGPLQAVDGLLYRLCPLVDLLIAVGIEQERGVCVEDLEMMEEGIEVRLCGDVRPISGTLNRGEMPGTRASSHTTRILEFSSGSTQRHSYVL